MSQTAAAMSTANDPAESGTANTIYMLYLVGLIFPLMPSMLLSMYQEVNPITGWLLIAYALAPIIGCIVLYVDRDDAPAWVQTHYIFQSRTLWLGLLYGVVAAITTYFYFGWVIAFLAVIWWIVRCTRGMRQLACGMPHDQPEHYFV